MVDAVVGFGGTSVVSLKVKKTTKALVRVGFDRHKVPLDGDGACAGWRAGHMPAVHFVIISL
jgi:hypothetical protein